MHRQTSALLLREPFPEPILPLTSLFADQTPPPSPPLPPRIRVRERHHACSEFIRKVKGAKYQVRWWIESAYGGSINCGLYSSEWEAERVRDAIETERLKVPGRGRTALSLWAAIKPLIARGVIPEGILPKYVKRREDGLYMAMVRLPKRGSVLTCPGPFANPEDAHTAMIALLEETFRPPAVVEQDRPRVVMTLVEWLSVA